MRDISDEEDDESFVTIGTPLPLYEEDEIPVRKPVALQDQQVRDAQGRLRFHGAFTGGFSAGYFNTVDTKEGWMPKTFKSSRAEKAEISHSQKPEDFMDDEDFSEYGIAPKRISTTKTFTDPENSRKVLPSSNEDGFLFGSSMLTDLVMPCRSSIGVRLLRKLGWRDGQGIGPREKKRKKPNRGKSSSQSVGSESAQKLYGCALPAGLHKSGSGGESDDRSSDDDDNEETPDGITFAPHDLCPINFEPKDNVHGLGYSGIDLSSALFQGNRYRQLPVTSKGHKGLPVTSKGHKGIRGQAFGVGAYEDEDEDVYGVESMDNYDFVLGVDDHDKSSTFGWTAPKYPTGESTNEKRLYSKDNVIDGFRSSSVAVLPKKQYPPPQLPPGFRPFHKFESSPTAAKNQTTAVNAEKVKLDAISRGLLLGERPHLRSVFELVSTEDRAKMEAAKMEVAKIQSGSRNSEQTPAKPLSPQPLDKTLNQSSTETRTAENNKEKDESSVAIEPRTSHHSPFYLPFSRDKLKQRRYEAYLGATRHNRTYVHDPDLGGHMTDWEKEREKEEFAKAAQLYQPLSNMISSRFTPALHDDDDQNVELPAQKEKSSQAKAAEMKMFGTLTRERLVWHPDKLVCRRFNIADPYPESNNVGLLTAKREKCNIYNFLTFPSENENQSKENTKETESQQLKESENRNFKPLAILATVDLRPKNSASQTDVAASNKSQESSSLAPAEASTETGGETDVRPPIDLFKAIFEDSDHSGDSSSDENQDNGQSEIAAKLKIQLDIPQAHVLDRKGTQDDGVKMKSFQESSDKAREENVESGKLDQVLLNTSVEDPDDCILTSVSHTPEFFGPILPPTTMTSGCSKTEKRKRKKGLKDSDKEEKRHSKDKHKHKKAKSKKHKHKSKKLKTKSRSSGSEADDDDMYSESDREDIDQKLLSKLKGYVEKNGK